MYASRTTAKASRRGARFVCRTVALRVSTEAEIVGSRSVRSKAGLSGFGALSGSDAELEVGLVRFVVGYVPGLVFGRERFFERRFAAVRTCLASLGSVKMGFKVSRVVLEMDSGLRSVSYGVD